MQALANQVCEKVESKQRTTYNEVADELVSEFGNVEGTGYDCNVPTPYLLLWLHSCPDVDLSGPSGCPSKLAHIRTAPLVVLPAVNQQSNAIEVKVCAWYAAFRTPLCM